MYISESNSSLVHQRKYSKGNTLGVNKRIQTSKRDQKTLYQHRSTD
uniref:Uncharacterized protein n=1 Tax=Arundo donax TaxID=35708 RepID=A0A0A9HSC4_ARUDO